jgi:hypothetical protein
MPKLVKAAVKHNYETLPRRRRIRACTIIVVGPQEVLRGGRRSRGMAQKVGITTFVLLNPASIIFGGNNQKN